MKSIHFIAVAIVAVGALIAGAIVYNNMGDTDVSPMRTDAEAHVYGNVTAPTTIVEFSDYQCPFCARVHKTLKRIVDESNGEINWHYRHLPLSNHSHAMRAAVIGECVAREIGNDAFWEYTDRILANQALLDEQYPIEVATKIGLKDAALEMCMQSSDITDDISTDITTAKAFGGTGTPFSIIVFPDGSTRPVSGALPYEQWRSALSL